jgi:hypothetical protein
MARRLAAGGLLFGSLGECSANTSMSRKRAAVEVGGVEAESSMAT